MSKIERSIVIERSIQDVFDFVHDPTKDPLWQTTLLESQPLDEGPLRAGSRVREVRRFLGIRLETSWEVTEYEPPTRSAITSTSGPVPSPAATRSSRSTAGRDSPSTATWARTGSSSSRSPCSRAWRRGSSRPIWATSRTSWKPLVSSVQT